MIGNKLRNPVGGHVPVAGGLAPSACRTRATWRPRPCRSSSPTRAAGRHRPGDPKQDEAFRAACAAEAVPAYVHAPYLINFGSHTEATVEKSVASLRHSLRRGREIGALGVVVHTGFGDRRAGPVGRRWPRCGRGCCRCWTS